MKRFLFVLLLGLSCTFLLGQSYFPLIRPNIYWDNAEYVSGVSCYTTIYRNEFITGDSLIEGNHYRLMNQYPFIGKSGAGSSICPPYFVSLVPFREAKLREDTALRKVFIYDINNVPHDQLLYDFSLKKGDTLQSAYATLGQQLIVDTVFDTVLLNGDVRKIFCFDQGCMINYIEGIGGWQGLSYPIVTGLGFGGVLKCTKENGIFLWGSDCDFQFVSTPENSKPSLKVFPNPAGNITTLRIQNMSIGFPVMIKLHDVFGNEVKTALLATGKNEYQLDISELRQGFYVAVIESEGRVVVHEKLIVRR